MGLSRDLSTQLLGYSQLIIYWLWAWDDLCHLSIS